MNKEEIKLGDSVIFAIKDELYIGTIQEITSIQSHTTTLYTYKIKYNTNHYIRTSKNVVLKSKNYSS